MVSAMKGGAGRNKAEKGGERDPARFSPLCLGSRAAVGVLFALAFPLAPLACQDTDTLPASVRSFPLWQAGAVAGLGLLTIAVADVPINEWVQDSAHRSDGLDDLASVTKVFGEGVVIAPVTLGLIAVGVVANKPPILHAGLRVGASVLLTTAVTQMAKYTLGRERPGDTDDPWDFQPFSGAHAMWSGHTSSAFAFATALSQEINRPWATVGLYALATGTAWSRVYENKHWASDVLVGAAAGIACAKIATGRWTIFGVRAPVPLASPGRAGLMWSGTF